MQRFRVLKLVTIGLSITFNWCCNAGTGCGEYEIQGYLRKVDSNIVLKLYEKSMSETTLRLSKDLEAKATNYLNLAVILRATLKQPVHNYRGQLELSPLPSERPSPPASDDSDNIADQADAVNEPSLKTNSIELPANPFQLRVPNPAFPELDSQLKVVAEAPCQ